MHPLEPLTKEEIEKVANIFRTSGTGRDKCIFSNVQLIEPSKLIIREFKAGQVVPRDVRLFGMGPEFGLEDFWHTLIWTMKK